MKSVFNFFLILILAISPLLSAQEEWPVEKSDHFFVYHQGNADLATDVKKESERLYKKIADEIGFKRYSNFWTWDNRCKIYIFKTKEGFLKETGQPQWSAGCANPALRSIYTYEESKNFLTSLLPHEMTHLIFRDFIGFEGEIPLWLDEGLAQFMEEEKRASNRETVKKIVLQKKQIPIPTLTQMDVRGSSDTGLVALFYAQASLLVGYLVQEFGGERFTDFCRQLRDGKSLEEALQFAYPSHFRSLDDLDQAWIDHISQ